jgi:hypothetical protein
MSLVSRLPRAAFHERDDIEPLRAHFDAIGASDEFYDARRIDACGDFVDVSWNDAGGAMLSAFGAHVLMRSRWVRGLAPQEGRLARNVCFGVFRGRLGEPYEAGVFLLAIRANDPGRLPLAELSESERELRERLVGEHRRCMCTFCAKYSFSESEADALAAGAKSWNSADLNKILRTLCPSERLLEAVVRSPASVMRQRDHEPTGHFGSVAPELARRVSARMLESGTPVHRARAARMWLRAHRTLGATPDRERVTALLRGPSVVASATADEVRYMPEERVAQAPLVLELVRETDDLDLVISGGHVLAGERDGVPQTVDRHEVLAALRGRLANGPPGEWRAWVEHTIGWIEQQPTRGV